MVFNNNTQHKYFSTKSFVSVKINFKFHIVLNFISCFKIFINFYHYSEVEISL